MWGGRGLFAGYEGCRRPRLRAGPLQHRVHLPERSTCEIGSAAADGHGCVKLPCSQTGCPANFVCTATATIGGCTPKPCASDCDSAFCVDGLCSSVLGTCVTILE